MKCQAKNHPTVATFIQQNMCKSRSDSVSQIVLFFANYVHTFSFDKTICLATNWVKLSFGYLNYLRNISAY